MINIERIQISKRWRKTVVVAASAPALYAVVVKHNLRPIWVITMPNYESNHY
jgi:hypothetical protein